MGTQESRGMPAAASVFQVTSELHGSDIDGSVEPVPSNKIDVLVDDVGVNERIVAGIDERRAGFDLEPVIRSADHTVRSREAYQQRR